MWRLALTWALIWPVLLTALASPKAQAAYGEVPESQVLNEISIGTNEFLPSRLQLMTWNIQKASGEIDWKKDLRKLAVDKHLVVLQEGIEERWVLNTLRSVKTLGWWMARSFFLDTDRNGTGVISGSQQTAWSQVFLKTRDREPFANTPKISLLTTYRLQNGSRLMVVNIHGINFTTLAPFQRQMRDVVGALKDWDDKIIWAGDFNTWNDDRTDYLKRLTRTLGLKSVRFQNDNRFLVLDHIFVRGCTALSSKVHSDIESSDHYPLSAELDCTN